MKDAYPVCKTTATNCERDSEVETNTVPSCVDTCGKSKLTGSPKPRVPVWLATLACATCVRAARWADSLRIALLRRWRARHC